MDNLGAIEMRVYDTEGNMLIVMIAADVEQAVEGLHNLDQHIATGRAELDKAREAMRQAFAQVASELLERINPDASDVATEAEAWLRDLA